MALTNAQKRNAEKNRRYWAEREAEALRRRITDEKQYDREIRRIHENMLDACQKEIESFYAKYAGKEGITIAEAKKRVSKLDIAAYERKAARYVKEKNFSPKANEEMRLYNATMRINRMEMLKANIGMELIAGHDQLEKFMGEILKGRTMDELERQAGILGKTVRFNAAKAHAIVNGSFHNGTFSDRIWQYQDIMRQDLGKLLQQGLIQGKNARAITKDLRKYLIGEKEGKGATYNVERLMRTELARVQTEAQKQSFIRNGFEHYEFLVNTGCCDICAGLNGKHFPVAKMMPGENAPPLHPHCRCSVAAWEDSKEYDAWLDYLEKGGTTAEWNATGKAQWQKGKLGLENSENSATIKADIAASTASQIPPVTVGGVDCAVTNGDYGFGDGRGGVKKTAEAVTYTTPDGTKFVFPKKYNKKHQTMTPEQAISNWQRVPQSIRRQAQKTVEVVDYYNPADSHWRKVYKNFTGSYATGGDKITFYRHDTPHNDGWIVRTYCHEAGHFIDTNLATSKRRFSEENAWVKAMADDMAVSGKASCTTYGENANTEDFAESVAEYIKDKTAFTKDFPNRAAILAGII